MVAAEGYEEVMKVLIEQGTGVRVRDIEGKTFYDLAKWERL